MFPSDISLFSWRYVGVLEIFDWCPGDIYWCPLDTWLVFWRYMFGVLEIFDWCPGNIWLVS